MTLRESIIQPTPSWTKPSTFGLKIADLNAKAIAVNRDMIKEQARRFATKLYVSNDFKFSQGWLDGFKRRHEIKARTVSGESESADVLDIAEGRESIKSATAGYSLDDIYNFDETGFFFRLEPTKNLGSKSAKGKRKDKERITPGLCINANGSDKLPPVMIAKSKHPWYFGMTFDRNLILQYYCNSKAWMAVTILKTGLRNRMPSSVSVVDTFFSF